MKKKTTTEGMIKAIVWSVANNNLKKCLEIAEDTNLDRGAVSRYVQLLVEIGVLISYIRKGTTYYVLNQEIQKHSFIRTLREDNQSND